MRRNKKRLKKRELENRSTIYRRSSNKNISSIIFIIFLILIALIFISFLFKTYADIDENGTLGTFLGKFEFLKILFGIRKGELINEKLYSTPYCMENTIGYGGVCYYGIQDGYSTRTITDNENKCSACMRCLKETISYLPDGKKKIEKFCLYEDRGDEFIDDSKCDNNCMNGANRNFHSHCVRVSSSGDLEYKCMKTFCEKDEDCAICEKCKSFPIGPSSVNNIKKCIPMVHEQDNKKHVKLESDPSNPEYYNNPGCNDKFYNSIDKEHGDVSIVPPYECIDGSCNGDRIAGEKGPCKSLPLVILGGDNCQMCYNCEEVLEQFNPVMKCVKTIMGQIDPGLCSNGILNGEPANGNYYCIGGECKKNTGIPGS